MECDNRARASPIKKCASARLIRFSQNIVEALAQVEQSPSAPRRTVTSKLTLDRNDGACERTLGSSMVRRGLDAHQL